MTDERTNEVATADTFKSLPKGFHTIEIENGQANPPLSVWVRRVDRAQGVKGGGFQSDSLMLTEEHREWCEENLRDGYQIIRFRWRSTGSFKSFTRCCCPTCIIRPHNKRDIDEQYRWQYRYGLLLGSERDAVLYRMFHYEVPTL